jgi:uncharacterized phage infection (PIP) family protein YhgE
MDWDDLDAEAQALTEGQAAIESGLQTLGNGPTGRDAIAAFQQQLHEQALRLRLFLDAVSKLRQ